MTTKKLQGRPRDPATDQAILDAAIQELAESGYENTSFEAIARRCGSSRTTIYRRYANKAELVVAAVDAAFRRSNPGVPDTGDSVRDVTTLAWNTTRMLTETQVGDVFRAIIPALQLDETLAKRAAKLEAERRELMLAAIDKGIDSGQLPPVDADLKTDEILGAIYLRFLLIQKPLTRAWVSRMVRDVLSGRATSDNPMRS